MLVHDAFLGGAHEDRLGLLEGGEGVLAVARRDRFLDLADERAHARAARLVDLGAAHDLARGLLGGLGIRHLGSIAPATVADALCDRKKETAASRLAAAWTYSDALPARQRSGEAPVTRPRARPPLGAAPAMAYSQYSQSGVMAAGRHPWARGRSCSDSDGARRGDDDRKLRPAVPG